MVTWSGQVIVSVHKTESRSVSVSNTWKFPEVKFTDDDPLARVEIGPNMDSHLVRCVSKVDEYPPSSVS